MTMIQLSARGQVTIPKHIRDARRWQPGLRFAVSDAADGVLLTPIRPFPSSTLDEVSGCLPWRGPARTLEQMEQAIRNGVAEAGKIDARNFMPSREVV